jgi:hypothetical protein
MDTGGSFTWGKPDRSPPYTCAAKVNKELYQHTSFPLHGVVLKLSIGTFLADISSYHFFFSGTPDLLCDPENENYTRKLRPVI